MLFASACVSYTVTAICLMIFASYLKCGDHISSPFRYYPSAHRDDKHSVAFEDRHPQLLMPVKFLNILILLLTLFLLKTIVSASLFIFFIPHTLAGKPEQSFTGSFSSCFDIILMKFIFIKVKNTEGRFIVCLLCQQGV